MPVLLLAVVVFAVAVGTARYWTRCQDTAGNFAGSPSGLARPAYELEQWIGRYLVSVLNSYITPQAEFARIDYHPPRTVVLHGLTLTSADRRIMSIDRALLELAEIPRGGQPVRIARIDLTRPHFAFVSDPKGGLLGWSHFVREDVRRNRDAVPPDRRLSDVLVLRHVAVHDGQVVYDPNDGSEPMTLPGIEMQLDTPPVPGEPGWYALTGSLQRAPVFRADLDGRINLDTSRLEVNNLALKTELSEEEYGALPPALQQLLRKHQVRGRLQATAQGAIPLNDPAKAVGKVQATLDGARLALAGFGVPLERLEVNASMPEGRAELRLAGLEVHAAGRSILAIKNLALTAAAEFGDTPSVRLEQVSITEPRLALIRKEAGGFVGWNDLELPRSSGPSPVTLGRMEVKDGTVTYEHPGDTIEVPGIQLTLTGGTGRNASSYAISGRVQSREALHASLEGRLDTDAEMLELSPLKLRVNLANQKTTKLLLPLREILQRYAVKGELAATFEGKIPLADHVAAAGRLEAEIQKAAFKIGATDWPTERIQAEAVLPGGPIRIQAHRLSVISGKDRILSLKEAGVHFTHLPQPGEPVEVTRIELDSPDLLLIRRPGGGLAGWSSLGGRGGEGSAPGSAPITTQPAGAALIVSEFHVRNGNVVYEPGDGGPAMRVPGIDMLLKIPVRQKEPGWYDLNGTIRREPILSAAVDGRINFDNAHLDLRSLRMNASLGERQYATLPPEIQRVLREHEVRGDLTAQVSGRIPMLDPVRSDVRVQANLQNGRIAFDSSVWPVDRMAVSGRVASGIADMSYDAALVGGTAGGTLRAGLSGAKPLDVTWNVTGVELQGILRVLNSASDHSGRISSQGRIRQSLGSDASDLSGNAAVRVTNGRLISIPLLREILLFASVSREGRHRGNDSADISLQLRPDRADLQGTVTSEVGGFNGRGSVYYSGRLDLNVRAEVVRSLQKGVARGSEIVKALGLNEVSKIIGDVAGPVGEGVSKLADSIVTYHVGGTFSNPRVSVRPGGL